MSNTTSYHVNDNNAHAFFESLIFVSGIKHENINLHVQYIAEFTITPLGHFHCSPFKRFWNPLLSCCLTSSSAG